MSALSDIVARLESGGGTQNASQPPTMSNPTFGQFPGFVNQFGSGASGVDNFANQVLASNPNATLGDFYAKYVLGTGNPASNVSLADLQNTSVPGAQGAFTNLTNNAGVPASTPLSSLLGASDTTSFPDSSSLTIDPNANTDTSNLGIDPATGFPFTDFAGGQTGPGGVDLGNFSSVEGLFGPSAPNPIPGTAGAGDTTVTAGGVGLGALFSTIGEGFARIGIALLGIILVLVGAYAATRGETVVESAKALPSTIAA